MNNITSPHTTDESIERILQAHSLAPRVTLAELQASIVTEHYFTAMDGVVGCAGCPGVVAGVPVASPLDLLTFCVLVLKNGFTVTGESACASPENFDAATGRKIARQNAEQKIWPLLGYELKTELARPVLTQADADADLAGTPRPIRQTN